MFRRLITRVFGKKKQQKPLMPEILFNDFIKEISTNDSMYQSDNLYYFYWGKWALDCVEKTLEKVGKREINNILDLHCGHGRALRFFKVAFPEATLTDCVIDREGVDFFVKTFGAKGVYSTKNLDEIQLDEKFDLGWKFFNSPRPGFMAGIFEIFQRTFKKGRVINFYNSRRTDY